jgi:hypothetical protein
MSGRVEFEGGPRPSDLSQVHLSLVQASANDLGAPVTPVTPDADGRFSLLGVIPGRYRLSGSANGWKLKSSVVGGQDSLDFPLDVKPGESPDGAVVTFSTRTTTLSGVLSDPVGHPTPDYTVVAFPADSRYWTPQSRRVQAARPATDGRFAFQDLPPGEYRLAAVADVEPGQWFDPQFLRQLIQASVPVTLGEGERRAQDMRIAAAK